MQAIGKHGVEGLQKALQARNQTKDKLQILTHCNTGSLATAEYGTALGVIRATAEANKLKHAYCTETRPYNQGQWLSDNQTFTDLRSQKNVHPHSAWSVALLFINLPFSLLLIDGIQDPHQHCTNDVDPLGASLQPGLRYIECQTRC